MGLQHLYPFACNKDNSTYTYRTDDNRTICLTAGVDGVTEEHIAALKKHHRLEINSEKRNKMILRRNGQLCSQVTCLDSYSVDELEAMPCLADESLNPEEWLVFLEHKVETHSKFMKAWATLTDAQKRAFYIVRIRRKTQEETAKAEGVSLRAIQDRLEYACKKLVKEFATHS